MSPDDDQGDLFAPPPERAFGGETYDPARDYDRLKKQLNRVFHLMQDGKWRTLSGIRTQTGGLDSEAAISARLRDFRKKKFGGHTVDRQYIGDGLFSYRLIVVRRTNAGRAGAPCGDPGASNSELSPRSADAISYDSRDE